MRLLEAIVLLTYLLYEIEGYVLLQKKTFNRCSSGLFLKTEPSSSSGKGFGKKTSPSIGLDEQNVKVLSHDSSLSEPITSIVTPIADSSSGILTVEEKILRSKMFQAKKANIEKTMKEKIAYLKNEEDILAADPSVGAVPELVADRMIRRIAFFFGLPVFGGLSIFVGAFFVSKKYDVFIPPGVIAYATQAPFVLGLIGISYAILSSSWDEVNTSEASTLPIKYFYFDYRSPVVC
jgi:hypothetical protein